VAFSRGGSRFPTATDAAVAIALLLAATSHLWLPALAALHQAAASGARAVTTIELVLDVEPTGDVAVNGYRAAVKYWDGEGYHLVFIVPQSGAYELSPSCCHRLRFLSPGKHYGYWLGGCVAVRTDR